MPTDTSDDWEAQRSEEGALTGSGNPGAAQQQPVSHIIFFPTGMKAESVQEFVEDHESPTGLRGAPVMIRGEVLGTLLDHQVQQKREGTRQRVLWIVSGAFGLILVGTMIAILRLPATEGADRMSALFDKVQPVMVAVVFYYFGTLRKER